MGLFKLFTKKNEIKDLTIEQFLDLLNSNANIDILKELNIPISKLIKADENQLKSNPDDVRNGVIEVNFLNHSLKVLGIFTSCVVKKFKSGRKQYFFFVTTENSDFVSETANILYEKLGAGIYDNKINSTFRDIDKIENISKGIGLPTKDECVTMWVIRNNLSLWLQYRLNPMKQFILMFDENATV
jgi:hypothetical protein